jgi:hypothetical protein
MSSDNYPCQHENSLDVVKYPTYRCTKCGALFQSVWSHGPRIVPLAPQR